MCQLGVLGPAGQSLSNGQCFCCPASGNEADERFQTEEGLKD